MDIQILAQKFYDYSLYIRGLTTETIKRYRTIITVFCRYANISRIEEVTNENVRALFFYGRTQRNWKSSTFIVFHKSLLVFFRWCVEEGYMQANPVQNIEVPKLERTLPSALKKQDALRLLEVITNYPYENSYLRYRNHALFSTFLFAGLRKSELLNLKLVDVDVDNLTIFVRQGKGRKDRIVPMSYTLALTLKRYLEERRKLKKTCPEFFASLGTNKGLSNHGLKHLVNILRKASNMKFTIHNLRHTFATLMIEGGCDIYSLSKMMGHSDITTTTIYLSASVEHLRSQMIKHPLNDFGKL